MLESVDRLIMKRLSLRPYNRVAAAVPQAARGPADADPLGARTDLRPGAPAPANRAARRRRSSSAAPPSRRPTCSRRTTRSVTFLAGDLGCVERVESRMATEALGSMFEGYVAQAGPCLPEFVDIPGPLDLVVHRSRRAERAERRLPDGVHRRPAAAEPPRQRPRDPAHLPLAGTRVPAVLLRGLDDRGGWPTPAAGARDSASPTGSFSRLRRVPRTRRRRRSTAS